MLNADPNAVHTYVSVNDVIYVPRTRISEISQIAGYRIFFYSKLHPGCWPQSLPVFHQDQE
jgi:hypothetical protein